mmetsp:Transcript_18213/g.46648  ORF Transcript_18213/g.46648 Transcript_18213/m.46648 type:complete len:84 (+) Transcript_18213:170-421(+)
MTENPEHLTHNTPRSSNLRHHHMPHFMDAIRYSWRCMEMHVAASVGDCHELLSSPQQLSATYAAAAAPEFGGASAPGIESRMR